MKNNALVIGLGNIGLGFDLSSPQRHVLTHTKAYLRHNRFCLISGIDPVKKKRTDFEKFTGKKAYADLNEFIREQPDTKIDIISLCTPDQLRLVILRDIIRLNPRALIIEKPLASGLLEGGDIIRMMKQTKISLFVNYIRRADPFYTQLKLMLGKKRTGSVQAVRINYTGGLFKNASHFINLMVYLFGSPLKVKTLEIKKHPKSYDLDASFIFEFKGFKIFFQFISDVKYSVGEIDIFCRNSRITIRNFGESVQYQTIIKDKNFPGFFELIEKPIGFKPELLRYQRNVLDHVIDVIEKDKKNLLNMADAYQTLELCEMIKDGAAAG